MFSDYRLYKLSPNLHYCRYRIHLLFLGKAVLNFLATHHHLPEQILCWPIK